VSDFEKDWAAIFSPITSYSKFKIAIIEMNPIAIKGIEEALSDA
jgi:hypothetical protein